MTNIDWVTLLVGALLGTFLGALTSWALTHLYYRRGLRKSLGLYEVSSIHVLDEIDGLHPDLTASFKGLSVKQLQVIELHIANDWDQTISDIRRPLQLTLPEGSSARILDVGITAVPEGRVEEIEKPRVDNNIAVFPFQFLDARQAIRVRLLIEGRVNPADIEATIQSPGVNSLVKMKTRTQHPFIRDSVYLSSRLVLYGVGLWWTMRLIPDASDLYNAMITWRYPELRRAASFVPLFLCGAIFELVIRPLYWRMRNPKRFQIPVGIPDASARRNRANP